MRVSETENLSVYSALMIFSGMLLLLSSPNNPEGISIEIFLQSTLFISLIISAGNPSAGRVSPDPKIASTIISPE